MTPLTPASAPSPAVRRRHLVWAALWLLLGGAGDYFTGAGVLAAPFYLLPVVCAGCWFAFNGAVLCLLIAVLLHLAADRLHPFVAGIPPDLVLNQALGLAGLGVLAGTSAALGRQLRESARHRERLQQVRAEHEAELAAARAIQELLNRPIPEHSAVRMGATQRPSLILGGDVLWHAMNPDGRLAFALGDVCGHGIPAALAAVVLHGLLEEAPRRFSSPGRTLAHLNQRLTTRLPDSMFITLYFGLLDLRTGRLSYANGGHEPPLLRRVGGPPEELRAGGMVLGVMEGVHYREHTLSLSPGDFLFCFTDGLTDLRLKAGGRLGSDAVREVLTAHAALDPPALLDRLLQDVLARADTTQDDLTMLAVQFWGFPPEPAAPSDSAAEQIQDPQTAIPASGMESADGPVPRPDRPAPSTSADENEFRWAPQAIAPDPIRPARRGKPFPLWLRKPAGDSLSDPVVPPAPGKPAGEAPRGPGGAAALTQSPVSDPQTPRPELAPAPALPAEPPAAVAPPPAAEIAPSAGCDEETPDAE